MFKNLFIFIVLQIIVLVPSFFFYRKIAKRLSAKNVKTNALILTIVMPVIYTIAFFFIYLKVINPIIRSKQFDQIIWKQDISSRYKMIQDIIESDLLIGKSKDEVVRILGNNFEENCWGKGTYCYLANDPDNYSLLDHRELVIHFDKNGIVNRVSYELI